MAKGRPADPKRATRGTGNRPKPGEAKKVRTPVNLPAKVDNVIAIPESFPPPESLPTAVHDVWRAVVADLGGANHMRESFLPSLVAYCQAVHLHAEASETIAKFGAFVSMSGKMVANPAIKTQKDAAATMLRFAETLGLTPAARIRVGLMEVTGMSVLASLNSALDGK